MNPTPATPTVRVVGTAALLVALSGCGVSSRTGTGTILYSDGCVIYIEGFSTTQAQQVKDDWLFTEECDLKVISESGENDET